VPEAQASDYQALSCKATPAYHQAIVCASHLREQLSDFYSVIFKIKI